MEMIIVREKNDDVLLVRVWAKIVGDKIVDNVIAIFSISVNRCARHHNRAEVTGVKGLKLN